ncbi:transcriptional regulator UhpA [Yersinia ruckeri]|uniref:transcriptional regulator UhpA n=1 Tax=Yersinia ruckeri TaxID=29486 RepID=UPI0011A8DE16|nr:transcriptional regulator UhpA [Yersinia ruckeri]EKN3345729.1 transcriptional regulator UhpA [Yersinia ruckeri]ELM3747052.1 transcriptional regulator UhpA [Yersinia ruckeri]MCK8561507.1 transcriptional regulator UhpA [Yersinia ruckeri]MCW6549756.1 transcriptional regulator UhpA [Yersinia ruckeri]MCW6633515.1 transcriptional regulator UhpA [Yersinia ruckeri]
MTYRVAFIDDHDIVRSGFVQLLSMEDDIQVVGEFSSAQQARAGLPGLNPHICICDISMPDQSGLDLLKDIPSGIRVIMLSMHDSPALVEMALERGAKGFLSKRCKPEDLITAVRTVGSGGVYLMPEIAQQLVQVAIDPLTRREREVAILLAQGMEVREIAKSLSLSPKTVHVHRANLFAKLGISNNVELAKRVLSL